MDRYGVGKTGVIGSVVWITREETILSSWNWYEMETTRNSVQKKQECRHDTTGVLLTSARDVKMELRFGIDHGAFDLD